MTIELANHLVELRKKHGYSQEELADKLQISRQAVSKWERSEASPDTDNLIELAKLYNVSMDELLMLSEEGASEEVKEEKEESPKRVEITEHVFTGRGDKEDEDEDDDYDKDEDKSKPGYKVQAIVSTTTVFGSVIAYILLGSLLGLWGQAWVLFLLIPVVPTIVEAIRFKKISIFLYPVFIAFVYLLICAWVCRDLNLWHPLWVIFLTIPIFYTISGIVDHKNEVKNQENEE